MGEMVAYELKYARKHTTAYMQVFADYFYELACEDRTLSAYNPSELAKKNLDTDSDQPHLIYVNGNPVGLVVFSKETGEVGEGDCHTYLTELYVSPRYRGYGIGTRIALNYFNVLDHDTGLRYPVGSKAETFWMKLLEQNGYDYEIYKEDAIRNFVHIHLPKKVQIPV